MHVMHHDIIAHTTNVHYMYVMYSCGVHNDLNIC